MEVQIHPHSAGPDTAAPQGDDLLLRPLPTLVEGRPDAVPTLAPVTVDLLSAGVPANTRRAYAADRAEWIAYAELRAVEPLPVCPDLLADYAASLLTVGSPTARDPRPLAANSVTRRLSAISTLSVEQGYGRPDLRAARLVLRGHRRTSARETRQAAPITVPVLRALVAEASRGSGTGQPPTMRSLRDRTIVLLGFALGARRSELVALDIADLLGDPAGMRVRVLRAKTADRRVEVAVPWATEPSLCPVRAASAYRAALIVRDVQDGPLFRRITRTDAVLSTRAVGPVGGRSRRASGRVGRGGGARGLRGLFCSQPAAGDGDGSTAGRSGPATHRPAGWLGGQQHRPRHLPGRRRPLGRPPPHWRPLAAGPTPAIAETSRRFSLPSLGDVSRAARLGPTTGCVRRRPAFHPPFHFPAPHGVSSGGEGVVPHG